jgi:hypothetical protein
MLPAGRQAEKEKGNIPPLTQVNLSLPQEKALTRPQLVSLI